MKYTVFQLSLLYCFGFISTVGAQHTTLKECKDCCYEDLQSDYINCNTEWGEFDGDYVVNEGLCTIDCNNKMA